ncbi:MAG: GNAT family N-acetyltransferase [Candidatus Cloacimonetes bacterium]|nr:GNAT family N-acetyltransferase [Candidatus Cloacimonadota bacterium]
MGFDDYFYNYSTWKEKNGLYLEDIYITQKYRCKDAGRKLLKYLAKISILKNYGRFELSVINWNESSYAKPQIDWVIYRMEGDTLRDFANK